MDQLENLEFVKELIEKELPGSQVEVSDLTGTRDHLNLVIISDAFQGKPLIKQHQMVMDILKAPLQDRIHAVQIKTLTPNAHAQSR